MSNRELKEQHEETQGGEGLPREYQKTRNNPYLLPDNLYNSVKYRIKDYDRLKEQYHSLLHESPPPRDGQPGGSGVSFPTENKALRREVIFRDLECIEQALLKVPSEYRKGVFDEARYGGGFPIDASRATYQRWKQKFVYYTAGNMHLI